MLINYFINTALGPSWDLASLGLCVATLVRGVVLVVDVVWRGAALDSSKRPCAHRISAITIHLSSVVCAGHGAGVAMQGDHVSRES